MNAVTVQVDRISKTTVVIVNWLIVKSVVVAAVSAVDDVCGTVVIKVRFVIRPVNVVVVVIAVIVTIASSGIHAVGRISDHLQCSNVRRYHRSHRMCRDTHWLLVCV